jgi:hypothetical protein
MNEFDRDSPIVIGGVGGSGTRIIAEILKNVDIFLGTKLNESLDNIWFTFLFKHNDTFIKEEVKRTAIITRGLDIFTEAMVGESALSRELHDRVVDYITNIDKRSYIDKFDEYYLKGMQGFTEDIAFSKRPNALNFMGWGWKEPNSHVFLKELSIFYNNLRYIHVIRHGLDMAYSKNQNQVKLWGDRYGVIYPNDTHDPASSFRYWLKANQKAINLGKKSLKDRFFISKYEDLCNSPEKEIQRLMAFLKLSVSDEKFDRITKIPASSSSIGRYKDHDTSWMTDSDIKSLNLIGYQY